jgi:hypothetical protein
MTPLGETYRALIPCTAAANSGVPAVYDQRRLTEELDQTASKASWRDPK